MLKMAKKFIQYNIVISCPSDMDSSRHLVEQAVNTINEQYGEIKNCRFQVKYWSKDVLFTNGDPQELINRGIIDDADLVIALFGGKLGSPTEKAASGTIEEIEEMIKNNKDTIVCFWDKEFVFNTSESAAQIREWTRLQDFKDQYKGLYLTFKSDDELVQRLVNQLRLFLIKKSVELGSEYQTKNIKDNKTNGGKKARENNHYEKKSGFIRDLLKTLLMPEDESVDDEDFYDSIETLREQPNENMEIVLIKPERYTEVTNILDHFHNGETILIDLEMMDIASAHRLIDTISGGAYLADGYVRKIAHNVFLVTKERNEWMFDNV